MKKQLITRAIVVLLTILSFSFFASSCKNHNKKADTNQYKERMIPNSSPSLEERLEKVVSGMTEDEVIKIVGEPQKRQYDSYTGAVRLYYYSYKVVLRDGVVHHWEKMYD